MDDVPLHSHVIPNPLCDVKQLQNVIETLLRKPLDNRQKNAEERNGGDHNARGGSDIFPTRPSDFFQFDTNIMKKFARALERTAHPLLQFGWLLFFFHLCHLRCHGPLPFLTSCPALLKLWQGRRDSNPHTRFSSFPPEPKSEVISLLCAPCACGTPGKTSWSPCVRSASSCFLSLCSCD